MSVIEAEEMDLTEDGGVKKTIISPGTGEKLSYGAVAKLKYTAKIKETGELFAGGEAYRSTVNDNTMIPGWDIGLSSMAVGEKARISCVPSYGYGDEGVPPVIPGKSNLEFEIEVLECEGNIMNPSTFADANPLTPRTPQGIMDAYLTRQEAKANQEEETFLTKLQGFLQRASGQGGSGGGFYVFGLFEGQTGERPPWYLNPFITFPGMFAIVFAAFYVVFVGQGITLERSIPEVVDDIDVALGQVTNFFG